MRQSTIATRKYIVINQLAKTTYYVTTHCVMSTSEFTNTMIPGNTLIMLTTDQISRDVGVNRKAVRILRSNQKLNDSQDYVQSAGNVFKMIERMAGYQVAGKITLVTLYCQVGVHRIPRTEIMDHNKHNFTDF